MLFNIFVPVATRAIYKWQARNKFKIHVASLHLRPAGFQTGQYEVQFEVQYEVLSTSVGKFEQPSNFLGSGLI